MDVSVTRLLVAEVNSLTLSRSTCVIAPAAIALHNPPVSHKCSSRPSSSPDGGAGGGCLYVKLGRFMLGATSHIRIAEEGHLMSKNVDSNWEGAQHLSKSLEGLGLDFGRKKECQGICELTIVGEKRTISCLWDFHPAKRNAHGAAKGPPVESHPATTRDLQSAGYGQQAWTILKLRAWTLWRAPA